MNHPEEYLSSDTTAQRPNWLGELEAVHVPGVGWVGDCMGENTPIDNRYALLVGPSRNPYKLRARLWNEKTGTWGTARAYWVGVLYGLDVVDQDDAVRFRDALAKGAK